MVRCVPVERDRKNQRDQIQPYHERALPQQQRDAGELDHEGRKADDVDAHHRRRVHVGRGVDDGDDLLGEDEGEGEQRVDERSRP